MEELRFNKKINTDEIAGIKFTYNDLTYGPGENMIVHLDDTPIGLITDKKVINIIKGIKNE